MRQPGAAALNLDFDRPNRAECWAFSLRLLGDDAWYVTYPSRTSPSHPGHGVTDGRRLREDWFSIIDAAQRQTPASAFGTKPAFDDGALKVRL